MATPSCNRKETKQSHRHFAVIVGGRIQTKQSHHHKVIARRQVFCRRSNLTLLIVSLRGGAFLVSADEAISLSRGGMKTLLDTPPKGIKTEIATAIKGKVMASQ